MPGTKIKDLPRLSASGGYHTRDRGRSTGVGRPPGIPHPNAGVVEESGEDDGTVREVTGARCVPARHP